MRGFEEIQLCSARHEGEIVVFTCLWHNGSLQAGHTGSSYYAPELYRIGMWQAGCLI
jgi:hypothetical protein